MDPKRRTQIRRILRPLMRLGQDAMIRVTVEGVERIPPQGPLLIAFNHLSNFDGPLVMTNCPYEVESVGPGDFKLLPWQLWGLNLYGMTLIKRGSADRASLKALIDHLKAGRILGMAPSGGTWEKRITDIKPGAAYISQVTQSPILPGAIGGAYLLGERIRPFRRPQVIIRFGEVMPPVPRPRDRRQREAELEAASRGIARQIYELLPAADRALYDRWARERYDLRLEFATYEDGTAVLYDGPALPSMAALGEFVVKPNLFRPMWQNAGLNLQPFMEARYFAPVEVQTAARELREALSNGTYVEYIPYRLGVEKNSAVLRSLEALYAIGDWAISQHARVKITPVIVPDGHLK